MNKYSIGQIVKAQLVAKELMRKAFVIEHSVSVYMVEGKGNRRNRYYYEVLREGAERCEISELTFLELEKLNK